MSGARSPNAVAPRRLAGRRRPQTQEKLEHLLSVAAELIARQGYKQTAIRDVGRRTGASLAGLYYYFKNKEDLLFQIQHRTFSSLVETQEQAAARGGPPEEVLRRLVIGHLAFFARRPHEMKVCTFELDSLHNKPYRDIERVRRRYYKLVVSVVENLLQQEGRRDPKGLRSRHVTLFIFGMINWAFMWHDPERDGPVEKLGHEMVDFALHGLTRVELWK